MLKERDVEGGDTYAIEAHAISEAMPTLRTLRRPCNARPQRRHAKLIASFSRRREPPLRALFNAFKAAYAYFFRAISLPPHTASFRFIVITSSRPRMTGHFLFAARAFHGYRAARASAP